MKRVINCLFSQHGLFTHFPQNLLLAILTFLASIQAGWSADSNAPGRILVFSKTAGYRHPSITNGLQALRQLGTNNHFEVVCTEDAGDFNDGSLAEYQAVVFLSTTGDVLDANQQSAFERYIRAGHGFVGIHAAADSGYNWKWYGDLVGARFSTHPAEQSARVMVEDFAHPSTSFLPEVWVRTDEWFDFQSNPRPNVHVLCRLDESSYTGGTMGSDHPIAWYHDYDGGRAWFTGFGHRPENFSEPLFQAHLLGGIRYAASLGTPPPDALVLFDGKDTSHWLSTSNQANIGWQVVNGALVVLPGTGDIHTFQNFQDYRLHLEFLVPPSPAGTPETSLANSGVFLQGLYEIQILDSYGRALSGNNDGGAIYSINNATTNASYPAGTWESYDIVFRAGRWQGSQKLANPRVSVWWNGVLVQDDQEIPRPTASTTAPDEPPPGPIKLQNYNGYAVQFRNIWVQPLDPAPKGKLITLIQPGSTWRYKDDGSEQPPVWKDMSFNDSTWSTGVAQLGYGGNGETTVIRKTRTDGSQIITAYFRKYFFASNVWSITNITLRTVRDDGLVAYLNGSEVLRDNMPAGTIAFNTPAAASIGGSDETNWISREVSAALLREGLNCLAVELHQVASTTDASFDLTLSAVAYEQPEVKADRTAQNLVLSWPALPGGFQLEASTSLAPSNGWQQVTNAPFVLPNKQSTLTLQPPAQFQFYRLRR